MSALGGKLAAARQAQGLSLDQLADRLRLGASQLEAIECADARRLPEPVFVVAQARRVAAFLGVDAEHELAALRASHPQPKECPLIKGALEFDRPEAPPGGGWHQPARLLALVALALGLVALATVLLRRQGEPAEAPESSSGAAVLLIGAAASPLSGWPSRR